MDAELEQAKNKIIARRKKELEEEYNRFLETEAKLEEAIEKFQSAQLYIRSSYAKLLAQAFMATDMERPVPRAVILADFVAHGDKPFLEVTGKNIEDSKEEKHKCAEKVALEKYENNWDEYNGNKLPFCHTLAATQLPCEDCATELGKVGVKLVIFTDYHEKFREVLKILRCYGVSYMHIPRFEVATSMAFLLHLRGFSRGDDDTETEALIRREVHLPELTFAPIPKHCPKTPKELPNIVDFNAKVYK